MAAYELGTRSPTARTLERLLAAAGLQLRVALEPLLADVDERVDAMLAGPPSLDAQALTRVATSLDEERTWDGADPDDLAAEPVWCSGRPRWAFDGATALTLHGLAVEPGDTAVVVVWEPAVRAWLSRERCQPVGDAVGWWTVDPEEAPLVVAPGVRGMLGLLAVRVVTELPPVLQVRPEGMHRVVPVVTVDEVERSFPAHAEVLRRWRGRRGG